MKRFRKDTEIFNGRYITDGDVTIINPTEEMLAEHGYIMEEYEPEPAETHPAEPEYGDMVDQMRRMLQGQLGKLTDKEALASAALFPVWGQLTGTAVKKGDRVWYDGGLYRVTADHTVREDVKPDASPLYKKIEA